MSRYKVNHTGIRDKNSNSDPYTRLCCAVLANAGREYMHVARAASEAKRRRRAKDYVELAARQAAIIKELQCPNNAWTRYSDIDVGPIIDSMHRALKREGCHPSVINHNS